MTDNDVQFIKARVHEQVAKIKPTVVPLAFTKCRWCGTAIKQRTAGGFCSEGCHHDFYGTTEADRDF